VEEKLQRGPKFRRRAEARPDEVLDAAIALFTERGFAQTRVEDIASRAGLSKGAVYLYFPSKEALLEGIVRRAVLPIADSVLGSIANYEGDPRFVLSGALKLMAMKLSDEKFLAVPKLLFREVVGFPQLAAMYRREVLDRVLPAITTLLRRGIEQGYLRPIDPELTLRSIVGPVMLHIALSEVFDMRPEGGMSFDQLIDNHLTILFDGMSAPSSSKTWSAS
jgi:AcrR family transcriptional regulator